MVFNPNANTDHLKDGNSLSSCFFSQISGRDSLRNIVEHFRFQSRQLYHLGIQSALSDANKNRSADFFQSLFEHRYLKLKTILPGKKKFKFKNTLYLLDSTTIDLCLTLFPWAKFRRTKAGVKIHTLLDHQGNIPCFVKITNANISDIKMARTLNLPPHSIIAMDRGYNDYKWFDTLTKRKIFFVSRLKSNAEYKVIKRNECLKSKGITSDQIIEFTGIKFKKDKIRLRCIGYRDPETGKFYEFLTNNFNSS
ncbi:MAG: IS4 family transposase [archaeon]|nr:IS4 family transposase [archaeon]